MNEQFHLVVATPCFGGQVSTIYARSAFLLQQAVRAKSNIDLKVHLRDGDALITRARANLVTLFLDDPEATHLLFVDADIGFEPEQVFRLIESGADVVAGAYPIKRINWEKAKRAMDSNRPKLAAAALDYVLELDDPDHVTVVNGFTRVRYAGTGFLMIRRHALERMCQHPGYASLQFHREHSLDALAGSPNRFALFESMIDPETGTYLSEDFAFCKRWTDIGGEIWADLESRLDHVGPSVFHGDISSQFSAPFKPRTPLDIVLVLCVALWLQAAWRGYPDNLSAPELAANVPKMFVTRGDLPCSMTCTNGSRLPSRRFPPTGSDWRS